MPQIGCTRCYVSRRSTISHGLTDSAQILLHSRRSGRPLTPRNAAQRDGSPPVMNTSKSLEFWISPSAPYAAMPGRHAHGWQAAPSRPEKGLP
jgi:hypothetical protein